VLCSGRAWRWRTIRVGAINSLARPEILQCRVFDFVDAFDLADEQFGIANQLEALGRAGGRIRGRDKA